MPGKSTLIINAGSSSLKFKLFDAKLNEVCGGIAERIGLPESFISFNLGKPASTRSKRGEHGAKQFVPLANHQAAVKNIFSILSEAGVDLSHVNKVGHRVVHGGEKFIKPTLITPAVLVELKKLNPLAPLHNPHNIAGIEVCLKLIPKAKHYAAFDTAFHATMPDFAFHYPLPKSIYQKYGVRRYGFHGLSHQFVSQQAAKLLKIKKPNLIVCHLGSGCSITAVEKGKSVDTSMGFTPLEGLMMATRTGDIDPSVVFYLNEQGLLLAQIKKMLNSESGLLGVCGLTDMRDILSATGYKVPGYKSSINFSIEQKKSATLALEMFIYRIKKYIGAYAVALRHVDTIIFTGGIGERSSIVRQLIMNKLPLRVKTLVVPTDEELMIARLLDYV
ncbi:MAG: acetate kinase [Parcubacteria group bacterium]